ncbi:COMM domain-containing protein 2 isoform X2 [Syngnathoides biaculeatus]|uniref:COMM domain-containing protein 2 isoform X2 n=1 Tax=Syngnathoides biaculeatus TaxID=300417 RepID=UPI002ADE1F69|nr:COMM domain-containing protein 2 isoform X2 [Syngnathoides biaculeatus]
MLLVLSEEHKEHLTFLSKVDAAGKLSVPVETVQHGVEALMYLVSQSSKHMLSEVDFVDSLLTLEFGDEHNQSLLQMYLQHRSEIRAILSLVPPSLPAYHNLEWRLDVQLASRALRRQAVPALTTKLHLTHGPGSGTDVRGRVLRLDLGTLLHLISILEGALRASKSTHARRILRNIK